MAADRRVPESRSPHRATLEPLRWIAGAPRRSGENTGGRIPKRDRRLAALKANTSVAGDRQELKGEPRRVAQATLLFFPRHRHGNPEVPRAS